MKPRIHRLIAITAAFAGLSLPAFAASGNWNTTTSGALWTLDTNWVGNVIADGSGSTADFSQVDLTADTAVSLNGDRTIGNLIFGDTNISTPGSWSLNGGGGALTLAGGTPSITVNALGSGKLVTLNAGLSGSSGFTKNGTGTLTLAGGTSNTLSGPITVNSGRLTVSDGLSLKNVTGAIRVASGAAFNWFQNYNANHLTNDLILSGAGDGSIGALNMGGNAFATGSITLNADTTISHDWSGATISGAITGANKNLTLASTVTSQGSLIVNGNITLGSGTLTKTGANSLELGGTNSWGAMVIETGAVYFRNSPAMGGTGANITIGTDGVAVLDGAAISTLLSRVNTASSGAIAFSSSSTDNIDLTSYPSLSVGTQVSMVLSGTITPGGGSYRLGGGGNTLTVSSTLSGSSGLLVNDAQGGTILLSGGHSYSGPTTVTAGTLQVDGSLSGAVTVAAAGTLAPGPASGIGSLTLASPLTVAGKLSFRMDRSNAQNADLITAPSLALTGVLSVSNIGPALQSGDSFKLFDISGSFTQSQVTFILPTLSTGLMWDGSSLLTTGTLKVAAVNSSPVGDTDWPGLLPLQILAVKQAGNASVTINPGTYQMPDKSAGGVTFDLNGWTNFTIDATGVTLVVGKQRTFQLTNCNNVTITGCIIRARYPSFTQGRVLSKGTNGDGTLYAIWKISDGYPTTFYSGNWFNAINQTTKTIDLVAGDYYGCTVADLGSNTWKITFGNWITSLAFSENDWLVSRLPDADQQLHGVRLDNSTNCTLQSITCQGGGFASVFEVGGGAIICGVTASSVRRMLLSVAPRRPSSVALPTASTPRLPTPA